jgi:hypothetical protein
MAFDITRRRALETARIDLTEGDGSPSYDDEGNRLSVTICGPASKTHQQAEDERNRRQMQRAEKNPRKIVSAIADHKRDDDNNFLASVTVSFNGWEYPHPDAANGGRWASQRDMFLACYEDGGFAYIRDQIIKEVDDHTAFTPGLKAN